MATPLPRAGGGLPITEGAAPAAALGRALAGRQELVRQRPHGERREPPRVERRQLIVARRAVPRVVRSWPRVCSLSMSGG